MGDSEERLPPGPFESEVSTQISEELNKYAVENEIAIMFWEHDLRGEQLRREPDEEGNVKVRWEKVGKQIVNEDGIQWLVWFLRAPTDKDTKLSRFSERRAMQRCRRAGHVLNDKLYLSAQDWDIDETNLDWVLWGTMQIFEASVMRAVEGAEHEGFNKNVATLQRLGGFPGVEKKEGGVRSLFGILGGKGGGKSG